MKPSLKAIIILALIGSCLASGSPISWTLSGVTFNDGGSASGSFLYDANTDMFTNWNVSVTAGSALGAFSYTPADSVVRYKTASYVEIESDRTFPDGFGVNVNRFLSFAFASSLTNAGGDVTILPIETTTQYGSVECLNCVPIPHCKRWKCNHCYRQFCS